MSLKATVSEVKLERVFLRARDGSRRANFAQRSLLNLSESKQRRVAIVVASILL